MEYNNYDIYFVTVNPWIGVSRVEAAELDRSWVYKTQPLSTECFISLPTLSLSLSLKQLPRQQRWPAKCAVCC